MNNIERSHIKLLQSKGINLDNINNDNVDDILTKLTTTRGKLLSGNYKTSILNTIKKLDKSKVTINKSQLSWKRNRIKKDRMSIEFMKCMHTILNYAYRYEPHKNVPEILSMIDTIIAILFLTSTNIKTKDIYDVTLEEFNSLHKDINTPIVINGKKIIVSPLLASQSFKKIEVLLEYKSKNFDDIVLKDFKQKRIRLNNYLISTAATQINKTVKKIYVMLNFSIITQNNKCFHGSNNTTIDGMDVEEQSKSLGLQAFRSLNQDMIYQLISTNF